MAEQILVPFNSRLQINDIISAIEEAGKPGMSVVFLIPYPVDHWGWLRDHWITTESSQNAMLAGKKILDRYSPDGQKALAEEKIAPWRDALQKCGAKVAVDVYSGSWSKAVENYSRGNEVSLLISEESDRPLIGFMRKLIAYFGLFKRAQRRPLSQIRSLT